MSSTDSLHSCSAVLFLSLAILQRDSSGEYKQFLGVAKGSSAELETQLLLLKEVYGFDAGAELILLGEVQKMLSAIVSKLSTSH